MKMALEFNEAVDYAKGLMLSDMAYLLFLKNQQKKLEAEVRAGLMPVAVYDAFMEAALMFVSIKSEALDIPQPIILG